MVLKEACFSESRPLNQPECCKLLEGAGLFLNKELLGWGGQKPAVSLLWGQSVSTSVMKIGRVWGWWEISHYTAQNPLRSTETVTSPFFWEAVSPVCWEHVHQKKYKTPKRILVGLNDSDMVSISWSVNGFGSSVS